MPQLPASLWPAEIVPDRLRSASRPLILPDPKGMEPCLLVSSNLARIAGLYSRRRHMWVHPTAPPAGIIRGADGRMPAGAHDNAPDGRSLRSTVYRRTAHERLSRFRNVRSCTDGGPYHQVALWPFASFRRHGASRSLSGNSRHRVAGAIRSFSRK